MALVATRASIAIQLHKLLREAIVRAELLPATALSEAEIAARYGVSRQPVREAFIRLEQEGLVEIRPQRGTFVKRIVASEVLDARFVREAIEVAVAREAALCVNEEVLSALNSALDLQRKAGTRAEFLLADEALHHEIAVAAGRESAWNYIDHIKAQMDRVRYLSYTEVNPAERLIGQHCDIVAAIAAGDPLAAERAVRAHMEDMTSQVPALAARYPELFA